MYDEILRNVLPDALTSQVCCVVLSQYSVARALRPLAFRTLSLQRIYISVAASSPHEGASARNMMRAVSSACAYSARRLYCCEYSSPMNGRVDLRTGGRQTDRHALMQANPPANREMDGCDGIDTYLLVLTDSSSASTRPRLSMSSVSMSSRYRYSSDSLSVPWNCWTASLYRWSSTRT